MTKSQFSYCTLVLMLCLKQSNNSISKSKERALTLKCQPHKMVKHTQTIRRLLSCTKELRILNDDQQSSFWDLSLITVNAPFIKEAC